MPRSVRHEIEPAGHDSFLDIVSNMVGILILLVMVVGVRAKNVPITASLPDKELASLSQKLKSTTTTEVALLGEIEETTQQLLNIQHATLLRHKQRMQLAMEVTQLKNALSSIRQGLNREEQAEFDRQRKLAESHSRLEQLTRERNLLASTKKEPIVLVNYPTPMSKTVRGPEVHFRLQAGRLGFVPLIDLVRRAENDAMHQARMQLAWSELTGTVGPLRGFRMRYRLTRQNFVTELVPVSYQSGEPVDEALTEGSEFWKSLSSLEPSRTTVTVWTYPDSFREFRLLQEELHRRGYLTAARPLPFGVPIGASIKGTKSAAQ